MGHFVDYLAELGLEAGRDYLVDRKKDAQLKASMRDYIEKQSNINEMCDLSDEIDFQGLTEYIMSEFLFNIKICLFGKKSERDSMQKILLSKACTHANAVSHEQEKRIEKLMNGALDILSAFYRLQIEEHDLFMSAETIDTIITELQKSLKKQQKELLNELKKENQRFLNEASPKNAPALPKTAENAAFQKLHNFVMTNYIKEKYREEELSDQVIKTYSDLFKLSIKIHDSDGPVNISKNIFDFVLKDILTQENENLIKITDYH